MNDIVEEILRLKARIAELEHQLQLERAEVIMLRRWIERLEENDA